MPKLLCVLMLYNYITMHSAKERKIVLECIGHWFSPGFQCRLVSVLLRNVNTHLKHGVDTERRPPSNNSCESVKIYTRVNVRGMGFGIWSAVSLLEGPLAGSCEDSMIGVVSLLEIGSIGGLL
jgi:hypothetical protein